MNRTTVNRLAASNVRLPFVNLCNTTMAEAIDFIDTSIATASDQVVFYVNANSINVAYTNKEFRNALKAPGTVLYGDGIGVRIAARLFHRKVVENINGTDMFPFLCRRCARKGYKIFLLGAKPGRADAVRQWMETRYQNLTIVGTHHGYFDPDQCEELISRINRTAADLLLVALGTPRQEIWIDRYRHCLRTTVKMGVGGLFDFYSGAVPRAPWMIRKFALEWVWRLAIEPNRLWKRYIIGNLAFLSRMVLAKLIYPDLLHGQSNACEPPKNK